MASFFPAKQRHSRTTPVPNGGLGGFVYLAGTFIAPCTSLDSSSTESTPSRQLPPVEIPEGGFWSLSSSPMAVSGSRLGLGGLCTPNTPPDNEPGTVSSLRSLGSRDMDSSVAPFPTRWSPPQTPTREKPLPDLPCEVLHASLPNSTRHTQQAELLSPTPSQSSTSGKGADGYVVNPASSQFPSDLTQKAKMEALRRQFIASSRRPDRAGDSAMPTYVIGESAPQESQISRPFTAMTAEELLDCLPDCDRTTISQQWLPALRAQFQKMITLLNDASELKLESALDQLALNKGLKEFSDELRSITETYRRAVESAESLVERDAKEAQERVKQLEGEMEIAAEKIRAKDLAIEAQDGLITELRHTSRAIAKTMGTFIQTNIKSWVDSLNRPSTQEVLQIIADYAQPDDPSTFQFIRLPEDTVARHARDIREAYDLVQDYRKVLRGQSEMIKDQSKNLDEYVNKYETTARSLTHCEREKQVLLEQHQEVTQQLENCEAFLAESRTSQAEAEMMARRYDELHDDMDSLKAAHKLELEQRDEDIASLTEKLKKGFNDVIREAELKNAAIKTAPEPFQLIGSKVSGVSKAARFFGMMDAQKERFKRGGIPASHSMIGFSSTEAGHGSRDAASSRGRSLPRHPPRLETSGLRIQTTHHTPVDSSKASSDSVLTSPDSHSATQRNGRLAFPADTQKLLPAPPTTDLLRLLSATRFADPLANITSPTAAQITSDYFQNSILGQTSARHALTNIPEGATNGYTEVISRDDDQGCFPDYQSDESVASSDREVYRKSLCALNMLNSSSGLPYSETDPDIERLLREGPSGRPAAAARSDDDHQAEAAGANNHSSEEKDAQEQPSGPARVLHLRPGNTDLRAAVRGVEDDDDGGRQERVRESFMSDGSGYRTEGSEPKTVAQLYHQGRRHFDG